MNPRYEYLHGVTRRHFLHQCHVGLGGMALAMSLPKELGGAGDGMNPEQLFALGYSSCFGQAILAVAKKHDVDAKNARVTCAVTLNKDETSFALSVDLTVASRKHVLTVPTDAIRDAATAAPWVFVVDASRVVRRDLTLGITGEGQSEISSGLSAGDVVVLSSARALEPGQRVRVQEAR